MGFRAYVDFQNGDDWEQIYLELKNLKRKRHLHKDFKPSVNTVEIRMIDDATIRHKIMTNKETYGNETKIKIEHATDGENWSEWFVGYIRDTVTVNTNETKVKNIKISCVDPGLFLKKKSTSTTVYINNKICDPNDKENSILHKLMILAGYNETADVKTTTTISQVIPYFIITEETTYWELLEKLLFEYCYVFYFDVDGKLDLYDLAPTSITTSNTFDNSNMEKKIKQQKRNIKNDGIEITWYEQKTLSNVVVFSDTTGGDEDTKAKIELEPGEYYPENADTRTWYADYSLDDKEFIVAVSPYLDVTKDSGITTITSDLDNVRAEIVFRNDAGENKTIYKFDIKGTTVVYKGPVTISQTLNQVDATQIQEIQAQYIQSEATAIKLGSALAKWYRYSNIEYEIYSSSNAPIPVDYNPNDLIIITENEIGLNVSQTCRIYQIEDNVKLAINNNEIIESKYKLEGLAAYEALTTTHTGHTNQSPPSNIVPSDIVDGEKYVSKYDDQNGYTDGATGATTVPEVPIL